MEATPIARTIARSLSISTSSGATELSVQASATTANAAGPQAVTIGRAASGTASVSLAAQTWKGMAPKRIATARAKAR